MSGFSEATMRERLKRLTNTLNSIQTLSLWLIHHHKKHADVILTTWLKEIHESSESGKLVSLMNLANDVVQNCLRKYPQFTRSYLEVLQSAFCHLANVGDERCKKTVERILEVWRDRQVYSKEELDHLFQCLNGIDALSSPSMPAESAPTPSLSGGDGGAGSGSGGEEVESKEEEPTTSSPLTPPETSKKAKSEIAHFSRLTTSLVAVLRRLEDPASADAKIRQLIAAYPENIANPSLLSQLSSRDSAQALMQRIGEAEPIVGAYCGRLKTELEDRRSAQRLLDDYIGALEESAQRNKALIQSVTKRVHLIEAEKAEMAKHIESLPDLNDLFADNPSSALPSLGELFTS